jgi:hypothetical protein
LTPAYDKQEDIYNALLLSVDTGTANVLSNGGSIQLPQMSFMEFINKML